MVEDGKRPNNKDIFPRREALSLLLKEQDGASIGTMLALIAVGQASRSPLIWIVRENEAKADTHKKIGEYSIPTETAKVGETRIGTLLGALAEVTDDQHLRHLVENAFLVEGMSNYTIPNILGESSAELAIMAYTGPQVSFTPINGEVSPLGWQAIEDLASCKTDIRFTLAKVLKFEETDKVLTEFIKAFTASPDKAISLSQVLPEDFYSIEKFCRQRELQPDVRVKPVQIFPAKK